MKIKYRHFVWGLLFCVGALSGCSFMQQTANKAPKVQILAYINISSGCQQATVDFLRALPQKYPEVAVELVDFGDGGAGARRWEASGLKCMAILINGSPIVKYPTEKGQKIAAFLSPAGLFWTHEELEEAVKAALAGTLQPATEEEFLASGESLPTPEELEKHKSSRAKSSP